MMGMYGITTTDEQDMIAKDAHVDPQAAFQSMINDHLTNHGRHMVSQEINRKMEEETTSIDSITSAEGYRDAATKQADREAAQRVIDES